MTLFKQFSRQKIFLLVAAILAILGSFMPWIHIDLSFANVSQTITGVQGDGIISLLIAITFIFFCLMGEKNTPLTGGRYKVAVGLSILLLVVPLFDLLNVRNRLVEANAMFSKFGISIDKYVHFKLGIYLVAFAGLVALYALFQKQVNRFVEEKVDTEKLAENTKKLKNKSLKGIAVAKDAGKAASDVIKKNIEK